MDSTRAAIEDAIWVLQEAKESLMSKFGEQTRSEVMFIGDAIWVLKDILSDL